jgi:hypothetical protein
MRGFLLLALCLAWIPAPAWTVSRSAAEAPAILSWEFFQEPGEAAWDSAEILIRFRPGAAIVSRIVSWPRTGPWSSVRPRMEWDAERVRLLVRRDAATAWSAAEPAPMGTFSVELRGEGEPGFPDVEKEILVRGFGPAPASLRAAQARPRGGRGFAEARDALGRAPPQGRAAKWRLMISTMRPEALPSP